MDDGIDQGDGAMGPIGDGKAEQAAQVTGLPRLQNFSVRDLAEVLLLLDNVSASDRANLPTAGRLSKPPFDDPNNWIEEICAIQWPPSPIDKKDAAKLLAARDALNEAARPATGRSIAFTLMVLDERRLSGRGWLGAMRDAILGPPTSSQGGDILAGEAPSRSLLARLAFPDLVSVSRTFRGFVYLFWLAAAILGVGTFYVSWDVAMGSKLLAAYNDDVVVLRNAIKALAPPTAEVGGYIDDQRGAVIAYGSAGCDSVDLNDETRFKCFQLATATRTVNGAAANVIDWKKGELTYGELRREKDGKAGDKDRLRTELRSSNVALVSTYLNVLGGSVLPILYGLLGAVAAATRSLLAKMEKSTLTPRFLHIAFLRTLLGALVGGCIGIFAVVPSESTTSADGLFGTVPLTAAALCFLAGYGVDVVFAALDGLLLRALNQPTATGDKPPTL